MKNQSSEMFNNVQRAIEANGAVVTGRDDMQFGSLMWFVHGGVEYSVFVGKRAFKQWPEQQRRTNA